MTQLSRMWISTLVVCLLFEVVSAQLNANGNTTGVYGGEAYYHCSLADTAGVLQVTWQRMYEKDDSVENLATYSKRFGSQINEPHKDKVAFRKASLSSTSITVMNLTWDDEACYICTFNAYPSGSRRKQTCLTVEGISHVNTDLQQSPSDDQVVFTCSATGKPAPTIQWNSTEEPRVLTVQNDDNTFTTTSNLTVQLSSYSAGHMDCLVNNVVRRRIPIPGLNADRKTKDDSGGKMHHLVIVGIILVIFVLSAAVLIRRKGCRKAPLSNTTEELDVFEEGVQTV